jgi:hypothetical protein
MRRRETSARSWAASTCRTHRFAMRYLHLTVEQFDELANPGNCDIITIAEKHLLEAPGWVTGRWGLTGLSRRPPEE